MMTGRFCRRAPAVCDIVPKSPSHTKIAIGTGIPWNKIVVHGFNINYHKLFESLNLFQINLKQKNTILNVRLLPGEKLPCVLMIHSN